MQKQNYTKAGWRKDSSQVLRDQSWTLPKPAGGIWEQWNGPRIKWHNDSKLFISELPTEIKHAKYSNKVTSLYCNERLQCQSIGNLISVNLIKQNKISPYPLIVTEWKASTLSQMQLYNHLEIPVSWASLKNKCKSRNRRNKEKKKGGRINS